MAVNFYIPAKEEFTKGTFNNLSTSMKITTVDSTYGFDPTHSTTADLSGVIETSFTNIGGVSMVSGKVYGDNYTFIGTSGADSVAKVILFDNNTSKLIACYDPQVLIGDGLGYTITWLSGIIFEII